MDQIKNMDDIKVEPCDVMKDNLNEDHSDSDDEEGEIKDHDEIQDTNEYDDFSNIYIDNLINGKENFFEDLLSFDCNPENLNDIDENDLIKTEEIKDRFEFRNTNVFINSDAESDEDTESAEEIEIPQLGSILDSLLDNKKKRSKEVEKTRKGRIVDKESELEYMIPADLEQRLSNIVVSVADEMVLIGTIIHPIEGTQTVTMKALKSDPILDLETVVFDKKKRMIGVIDNIFGTKQQPNYLVICKDAEVWQSLKGGESVFCAPSVKDAYFTTVETHEVHHDIDSDLAFSDDEKEEAYRRQQSGLPPLAKKGDSRKRKPGKANQKYNNANRPPHPHQPQLNNRMANPFFRVSSQPFGGEASLPPYWTRTPNLAMPPPPLGHPAGPPMGMPCFTSYPPPPFPDMSPHNYQYQQQFPPQYQPQQQFRQQYRPKFGHR